MVRLLWSTLVVAVAEGWGGAAVTSGNFLSLDLDWCLCLSQIRAPCLVVDPGATEITWVGPSYSGAFAFRLVWTGSLILPMAN